MVYGTISTIAVSPADPNTLPAGTDDGNVWWSANGGGNWAKRPRPCHGAGSRGWSAHSDKNTANACVGFRHFDDMAIFTKPPTRGNTGKVCRARAMRRLTTSTITPSPNTVHRPHRRGRDGDLQRRRQRAVGRPVTAGSGTRPHPATPTCTLVELPAAPSLKRPCRWLLAPKMYRRLGRSLWRRIVLDDCRALVHPF